MEQITPESYERQAADLSVALDKALTSTGEDKIREVRETIIHLLTRFIPGDTLNRVGAVVELYFDLVPSPDDPTGALNIKPKNLFTWLLLAGIYVPPEALGKATRYITRAGAYVYENDIAAYYPGNAAKWINTNASEYRLAPDIKKIP